MLFFASTFSAQGGSYKINPFNPVFFLINIAAKIKSRIIITPALGLIRQLQSISLRKLKKTTQAFFRENLIKKPDIQILPADILSR